MFEKTDQNSTGRKRVTKEEQARTIAALLEERKGYVQREDTERVAAVDAELKRLGAYAEKPSQRAQKRPAQQQSSAR